MDSAALRQFYRARRDALPEAERRSASRAIAQRLSQLPAYAGARQALFYWAKGSEADLGPFAALAADKGMKLALPRTQGPALMAFHEWAAQDALETGDFGILQPRAGATPVDLSLGGLVLVPGLVFDAKGARLGWGKGFYDRFLAALGGNWVKVGVAFECQLHHEALPTQPWDVPVDWVVSEAASRLGGQDHIGG